MADPGLLIVAELHGLAGRENELVALVGHLSAASIQEDGCLGFRPLSNGAPGELTILSAWTDQAAVSEHYASPHYRHYLAHVGPLLAAPSDVVVHHISASVHARDPNQPEPGMLG
jgi:quinol monooxygenase YgiN